MLNVPALKKISGQRMYNKSPNSDALMCTVPLPTLEEEGENGIS